MRGLCTAGAALALAACALGALADGASALTAARKPKAGEGAAFIRVNQVGYATPRRSAPT